MTDKSDYDMIDIAPPVPKPGDMEQYDRESLEEIKKKIAKRSYRDAQEVREHLAFLEKLADKLRAQLEIELRDGETGWGLKRSIDKVQETYKILASLLDSLE